MKNLIITVFLMGALTSINGCAKYKMNNSQVKTVCVNGISYHHYPSTGSNKKQTMVKRYNSNGTVKQCGGG